MKKIRLCLIALIGVLFLTFISCDRDDLSISQDEEILNLQLEQSIKGTTSQSSANGHGFLTYANGAKRQFTFHANTMSDGSIQGKGVLVKTGGGVKIMFDIDCLIIEGNTATMAGVVTQRNNYPEAVGYHCWFMVVDNGEGSGSIPDEISLFYNWPSELGPDCNVYNMPIYAIDAGNIQVK